MKNLWMAASFFFGTVALISCDSGTQEQDTTTTADTEQPTDTETASADTTLSEDIREFMGYAYRNSSQQIELGKLAAEKGSTPEVRQYGQKMVDLYGQRQKELKEIAGPDAAALPPDMTEDQMGNVQELRDKDPKEFDKAYWDTVVDAHKEALSVFDDKVKSLKETDNAAFNLWSRNSAKEVRAHMEEAMKHRQDLKS
jgi:putative membrane protein